MDLTCVVPLVQYPATKGTNFKVMLRELVEKTQSGPEMLPSASVSSSLSFVFFYFAESLSAQ